MNTSYPKPSTKRLLKQAITVEMLPERVTRSLAAIFSSYNPRTLARFEKQGVLPTIKGPSRTVAYRKSDFLKFLGLIDETTPVSNPVKRRRAAVTRS
jgi:hypothetical protein